jgi:hypothetical protein
MEPAPHDCNGHCRNHDPLIGDFSLAKNQHRKNIAM